MDVSGRRRLAASTPPLAGKPADCLLEHRKVQPSVPQIRRRILASSGTRVTADVLVPTGQAVSASTALQAASAQGEHLTALRRQTAITRLQLALAASGAQA